MICFLFSEIENSSEKSFSFIRFFYFIRSLTNVPYYFFCRDFFIFYFFFCNGVIPLNSMLTDTNGNFIVLVKIVTYVYKRTVVYCFQTEMFPKTITNKIFILIILRNTNLTSTQ